MQLNYAYRFLAQSDSMIPSSPWQHVTLFVEQESEIIKKILQKGYHIDLKEVESGTFIERYELA